MIEKELIKWFNDSIYKPLLDIIKSRFGTRFNSKKTLINDLLNGKIQYVDNKFIGQFNSASSKELKKLGAKYSIKNKTWTINKKDLPIEVSQAVVSSTNFFKNTQDEVIDFLDNINVGESTKFIDLNDEYAKILSDADKGFRDIVKKVSIEPKISKEMFERISEEYTNNMKLFIKDWSEPNINQLRTKVYKNTFAGYRADNLVEIIEKNYDVTKNKAKFLAKQETSLLMSKFREDRFKDAGINKYKWSTAKDNRVRDRHKNLQGKIFSWDTPPIINEKEDRGHPGEDFGCRCVAIAVID